MNSYRERLWPAPGLLVALLLLIPATLLIFLPVDVTVGIVVAIALYAAAVATLAWRSPILMATPEGIRAGAATLPASALGDVRCFVGDEARAERGVRLDARAWLVIRGGVAPVVRIENIDAADPVPYWLISSRHPERFAAAIDQVRQHTRGR